MKSLLILLFVSLISACAVEFKSDQFQVIKKAVVGDKRFAESKQWLVFFEGQQHTAYAVLLPDKVRFISLNHLEIDFEQSVVAAIREMSPVFSEQLIKPAEQGFLHIQQGGDTVMVSCGPLIQYSDLVYIQSCENQNLQWFYRNELQVNQKREVVYIKTHYAPSKPPLEMYHSPLFKALNK